MAHPPDTPMVLRWLRLAAVIELATGVALMAHPPTAVQALLGTDLPGAGVALGRVAGIGLFSLGLSCYPGRAALVPMRSALIAMFTYNLLVAGYLAYLGIAGRMTGWLLWPAVALHAALSVLLVRPWLAGRPPD